jgi:hypothetical protein
MQDDQLPVVFNNYDTEDFNHYEFESLMYGILIDNPGSDIFYDVKPRSEATKAEVEAYMSHAMEGTVYGALGEYDDPAILHTAKVLAKPEIDVGAFDAGPVVEDAAVDKFLEGPEIPEYLGYGTSTHSLRDQRDEDFVEYVLDTAANIEDAVVVHSVPTSVTLKFEREDMPVHRVNDQLVDQEELQMISSYHDPQK